MDQQYLIDSNVVIDYLAGKLPVKGMEFMNQIINKIPDAIIAASSLVSGFGVITRNTKDFLHISDLKVINPYHL